MRCGPVKIDLSPPPVYKKPDMQACPYCQTRPLYRSQSKTCGDKDCKKKNKSKNRKVWNRKKRGLIKREINCLICGKKIITYDKTRKTCGNTDCKKKHLIEWKRNKRGAREINCLGCGKKIITSSKKRKTCGAKDCLKKQRQKPLLNKGCIICKRPFQTRWSTQKTCGDKDCQKKRDNTARQSKIKINTLTCLICKKIYRQKDKRQKTCGGGDCKKLFYKKQRQKPENKERDKNRVKQWAIKNKDRRQKQAHESYLRNKETVNFRAKQRWLLKHPLLNKTCIICKKPFQTRCKKRKTCGAKYCMKKNTLYLRQKHYFKYYGFKGVPKTLKDIRKKYLFTLIKKQNNICLGCGNPLDLFNLSKNTMDHIYPQKLCTDNNWSLSETHHIKNLQVLCVNCNSRKNKKLQKLPYKEKANQACFEILDILKKEGISPHDFADKFKEPGNKKKVFDTCFNININLVKISGKTILADYIPYFLHNWKRLYGFGIPVFSFIPEGPEGDKILIKKAKEENKGWIDRDDFGAYCTYKGKRAVNDKSPD